MAYINTREFQPGHAGTRNGYCLQNVRLGYGVAVKYANAKTAWAHTVQHKDKNFPVADVPLFYNYGTEGHVNVRLADGTIWSDGTKYSSLDNYLNNHPKVSYLGWGEALNDVRIVQYTADPAPAVKNWIPANAVGKMDVILSRNVSSWRIYKPGTHTEVAKLNPKKNGGRYLVEAVDSLPNRVIITSPTYGRVSLPVDGDATFTKAA